MQYMYMYIICVLRLENINKQTYVLGAQVDKLNQKQ